MNLFIYGAGGVGREIRDIAERCNALVRRWEAIFFIDDVRTENEIHGCRIVRFEVVLNSVVPYECVIAQGEPAARKTLFEKLRAHQIPLATLIDPGAVVSRAAAIGPGSIVFPGAFISCDTRLGENSMVQINSVVGHDVELASHVVVSSGVMLGGGTKIGEGSFVGMGASIIENSVIGAHCIIGMGAVVFSSVAEGLVVLGHPARPMRKNDDRTVFGKRQ